MESKLAEKGLVARRAALKLINAVLEECRPISEFVGQLDNLAPSDRARAQRLAAMTFRNFSRADALLKPHLKRRPPPAVQNALRLAVVEIHADGAAAHGVVNSAVALMNQGRRTAHAAGLVNAILRKVADAGGSWARLPAERLPGWLRGRVLSAYGAKVTAAIEQAHTKGAPLDLTLKKPNEAADWADRLKGEVLPTGSIRLSGDYQVTGLPGYDQGSWWVQDAAATLPARILAAKPGERVADLCAAPGGKTMQLAASGADVTAIDISASRLARLEENLDRTGLSANLVEADILDWAPSERFDAILLDAPCSATGTIRRHPELPYIRTGKDLKALFVLQSMMIDRALELLKPGGRLLFATCSLLPEEGEEQAKAALARHSDIKIDKNTVSSLEIPSEWCSEEGGLRLRPDFLADRGGMDGFYATLFIRQP